MMKLFRKHLDDLLLLSGFICIVIGSFMVSTAIGFLVTGIEMVTLAVLIGMGDRNAAD